MGWVATELLADYTERLAARNLQFGGLTESTAAWCEISGANYTWEDARAEDRILCHIGSLEGYSTYAAVALSGILIAGTANLYAWLARQSDAGSNAMAPIVAQRAVFWWVNPAARPDRWLAVIASSALWMSRVQPEASVSYIVELLGTVLALHVQSGRYQGEARDNDQRIARLVAEDVREVVYGVRNELREHGDVLRALIGQVVAQGAALQRVEQMFQLLQTRPERAIPGAEVRLLEAPQGRQDCSAPRRARSARRRRRSEGERLQEDEGTISSRTRGAGARR